MASIKFTLAGFAESIQKSPATIKWLRCRKPWELPVFVKIGRDLFVLDEDYDRWLLDRREAPIAPPPSQRASATLAHLGGQLPKRGRGRPRKNLSLSTAEPGSKS